MKFISYIIILSLIINLIDCTGTIRFNFSYPENSKEVTNQNINRKFKIAIFDDGQNINNSNKEELENLKLGFQNQILPFNIETNRKKFNDFDLIILNYSVSYPSGFEKGMINTLVFLSYLQMFITLGVLHSVDFNYKYHQIDIYNPKTKNEIKISFTEQIQKEDGWAPFLFGKFNGEFSEKHKRYLVFNSLESDRNIIVKKIMLEAN
ncbi:hypothetical protein JWG41_17030 [Leptospira sp. 201903075]|uniref:hypothetical protein n=1 Tax=Leptospira chreensis TaxID=2810035 RepID=UPI001965358B|nr:hypothetical protein [Leptospira chreensis]MBM9592153.1 hypothetical protein [Leptospira chreensis]